MSAIQWVLIGWMAVSGIGIFVRGSMRVTRTYTMRDGIFGVIEVGIMIWLVTML